MERPVLQAELLQAVLIAQQVTVSIVFTQLLIHGVAACSHCGSGWSVYMSPWT